MDPDNVNACYLRLSTILRHRYYTIPIRNGVVNMDDLVSIHISKFPYSDNHPYL